MGYVVHTARETGTITYHCATPHIALEKLLAFRRADYWDITVRDSKDVLMSEGSLLMLIGRAASSHTGH